MEGKKREDTFVEQGINLPIKEAGKGKKVVSRIKLEGRKKVLGKPVSARANKTDAHWYLGQHRRVSNREIVRKAKGKEKRRGGDSESEESSEKPRMLNKKRSALGGVKCKNMGPRRKCPTALYQQI